MDIPVLVINLDRSKERWEGMMARAAAAGFVPQRIPAVDGNAVDPSQRGDLQTWKFRLWHGRNPLGTEYGCYMSHMRALERVIAEGWPYAVILEDDADFRPDFVPRIEALARLDPAPGVVKLYNHRIKGFLAKARTEAGDDVGRCIHGPLGSAMGYLVSRPAAGKLREALLPAYLPYDIALERGWAHGVAVATTKKPLLRPAKSASTISPAGYRKTKFPFYMRIPTALFRGQDYLRRAVFAVLG
ncbi:glycosyltransferase family 25 protein [Chelativorans sp. AA-79]|uniref:glycosyltransferase family 25 protein n=1 Tax=Chelativorans sp. AA-79 TaxID=3028735 RepID=UPI0023F77A44|nr:glycosyltransferase family 25 protein [Chelativorans sp. AA-79]WEX11737.1 glycosyltransferase family 25 protein [Chelativorans sp. AA-79]